MLAMTAANDKPHLAYTMTIASGNSLWDEANERHWQIVSMMNDFRLVFCAAD